MLTTYVDALLNCDGSCQVHSHVCGLATLRQEVEENLPYERKLGALLVRVNPLANEPGDTALEDTVTGSQLAYT